MKQKENTKKNVLIVDTNTPLEKTSKSRSSDHYKETHVMHLVDSLRHFVEDHPESIEIQDFYNSYGIPKSTYYDLVSRWPELKDLHENVMERLGGRMLSRSVNFKANWHPVKFILHRYSPEYAQAKEFDAMLAAKARESTESSNGPQIVVIEKFANSDIVPEKK